MVGVALTTVTALLSAVVIWILLTVGPLTLMHEIGATDWLGVSVWCAAAVSSIAFVVGAVWGWRRNSPACRCCKND